MAFVMALAVVLFFGVRLLAFFIYWADPAHRDQEIAGWMTPGYVHNSWDVPRDVIMGVLGGPFEGKRRRLSDIAAEQGQDVEVLIRDIERAIERFRAQ